MSVKMAASGHLPIQSATDWQLEAIYKCDLGEYKWIGNWQSDVSSIWGNQKE